MTMRRTLTAVAVFLLASLGTGCSDSDDSLIVLNFKTDQLDLSAIQVALLDGSDRVVDSHWLAVSGACQVDESGWLDLGSALIDNGQKLDTARVQVFAYRIESGVSVPAGDQRVDVAVRSGTMAVEVQLTRVCRDIGICSGASTCEPASGSCHEVPRVDAKTKPSSGRGPYCLTPLAGAPKIGAPPDRDAGMEVPDALMDGGAGNRHEPSCVVGDNDCPAGCHGDRDADCLVAVGKSCSTTTENCVAGAFCTHGFCCDQPCNGSCERCDLTGQTGHCSTLLYSAAEAPLSSPDISFECVKDHLSIECVHGECQASCFSGYGDCDLNLQGTGCETQTGTLDNCSKCGDACSYGYCNETGCQWNHTSDFATDGSWPAEVGVVYAAPFVASSADTMLRAIGVLVDPKYAGKSLRLALYQSAAEGVPSNLLLQTESIAAVDNPLSLVPKGNGALRVEARVRPFEISLENDYFIAVQVSEVTQLYGAYQSIVEFRTVPGSYGPFPDPFPLESTAQNMLFWSLYAITTEK